MTRTTSRLAATLATAAIATAVTAAPVGSAHAATSATPTATCRTAWGTGPKTINVKSLKVTTAATSIRAGHHACYDRVVVEIKGAVGAVAAAYPDKMSTVHGLGVLSSSRLFPAGTKVGQGMKTTLPTIKGMVYLGTKSKVDAAAVLTTKKLPFRLFVVKGPGTSNRLVIDIAHR